MAGRRATRLASLQGRQAIEGTRETKPRAVKCARTPKRSAGKTQTTSAKASRTARSGKVNSESVKEEPVPSLRSRCLNEEELQKAIAHLSTTCPKLAAVIATHDTIHQILAKRSNDAFGALTKAIVYQQLAGKAAATIHGRLLALGGDDFSPQWVLDQDLEALRSAGLSERKATYIQDLALNFKDGKLGCSEELGELSDEELFNLLTAVKGVGPWTTHMFMMFTLGRPDVLPTVDLGIRKGVMKLFGLPSLPTPKKVEEIAEPWRPFRSVGSYVMWHVANTVTC